MAKIKLKKLHKVKIHHNRWLIWAIAYVLFVTIALVGYLQVSDLNFDAQNAETNFQSWHNYTDARLGFTARYPASWSIEADNSGITFVPSDIAQAGATVSVMPTAYEKVLRKSLKIISENKINLGSDVASKIVNDLGGGQMETLILDVHNYKLYVIRGGNSYVQQLLLTFHFLQ